MGQISNPKLQKQIAERIKSLREAAGYTQISFLHETGIHVGRIEQGNQNITVATLKAICDHLGVSMAEFFRSLEKK